MQAFDHEEARAEGCIVPKSAGVDQEYDDALSELKDIEKELQSYLREQCQYFGVQVSY